MQPEIGKFLENKNAGRLNRAADLIYLTDDAKLYSSNVIKKQITPLFF